MTWFTHTKLKHPFIKIGIIILVQFIVFWLLGGLALLLYSSLMVIQRFQKMSAKAILGTLAIALAYMGIPYLMIHIFFQLVPIKEAYFSFVNFPNAINNLYFWVLVLGLILYQFVQYLPVKNHSKRSLVLNASTQIIVLILLFFLPKSAVNKPLKEKIKINLAADNQQWDDLLQNIKPSLIHDPYMLFQTNRALYFSKGLLTNLFHVPQYFGSKGLLLDQQMDKPYLFTYSDFYFDLGFMNESRHWAHEAFTRRGMQPKILKRLTLINISIEKYNTAQKYIDILKKSLNDKAWAIHYEKYLSNPSLLQKDIVLNSKKNATPKTDFFVSNVLAVDNLKNILNQGENKMAFEYLLAYHLLNHELIYVVNRISDFKNYGYTKLPRTIQEAIVLYIVKTHNNAIPMYNYTIEQDVINQFKDYSNLYSKFRKSDPQAKSELDKKYSQTLWYYIHFISPLNQSNS
jgi:hypothetical protein